MNDPFKLTEAMGSRNNIIFTVYIFTMTPCDDSPVIMVAGPSGRNENGAEITEQTEADPMSVCRISGHRAESIPTASPYTLIIPRHGVQRGRHLVVAAAAATVTKSGLGFMFDCSWNQGAISLGFRSSFLSTKYTNLGALLPPNCFSQKVNWCLECGIL